MQTHQHDERFERIRSIENGAASMAAPNPLIFGEAGQQDRLEREVGTAVSRQRQRALQSSDRLRPLSGEIMDDATFRMLTAR